jgi:TPR repeat protein
MKILQKICFVLLLGTFSSVHAGSCFGKPGDFDDCLIKAKQGDARAQYSLGWIYRGNKDIPNDVAQDYAESVKWYTKAAEQGHARAQAWLGVMYDLGWGVSQDYKAGAKWYRKAADQDNALGQLRLASFYSQGKGVAKNLKEAEKLYLRSASYNGDYDYAKKMIKEMYADNKDDWSSILHSIK